MQQSNPNSRSRKHRSLFSRFKAWCRFHRIPLLLFPIVAFLLVAVVALLIGGSIAGWDIVGFLKSPTGTLVYVVAILIVLGTVYFIWDYRSRK